LDHAGDCGAGTHSGANNSTGWVIEDIWVEHWHGIIRLNFEFTPADV
jgi:hypothetical protein